MKQKRQRAMKGTVGAVMRTVNIKVTHFMTQAKNHETNVKAKFKVKVKVMR